MILRKKRQVWTIMVNITVVLCWSYHQTLVGATHFPCDENNIPSGTVWISYIHRQKNSSLSPRQNKKNSNLANNLELPCKNIWWWCHTHKRVKLHKCSKSTEKKLVALRTNLKSVTTRSTTDEQTKHKSK